jgi:2-oxoglutarate dehydrogenase E2 component (dihydrolipoamide succinyltransferase)
MPVALKVPSVGESITEVEIGEWLKQEGAFAKQDEPVLILETEKATLELPAPVQGKVTQVIKKTGEKAAVGDVVGYMEESAEPALQQAEQRQAVVDIKPDQGKSGKQEKTGNEEQTAVKPRSEDQAPRNDVPTPKVEPVEQKRPTVAPKITTPAGDAGREEEILPMSPIRRRIADRLVEAQNTAALVTTFNQIDMSAVASLRSAHQEAFQKKYKVKLGLMSFFVKAAVEALKRIPEINAEIRGETIAYRNYYDIGIAIGGGRGLVVPVLRNAESLSFAEIEKRIIDFAERSQDNRIRIDELQGGTFTISNGGIYGSLLSTPIVNPPQSGVLGLHVIEDRAVVRGGQIVVRPMMYIALTYDHRIVDGREGVTFLKHVKELIEDPARILLEI